MNNSDDDITMTAIDGRDALAFVIVRPGTSNDPNGGRSVAIEAAANGIDMSEGAHILRHVADLWDAEQARAGHEPTPPPTQLPNANHRLEAIARLADALEDHLPGDTWHLANGIKRIADGTATPAEIEAQFED